MMTLFRVALILWVQRPEAYEPTAHLVPPGWQGNPWGPAATQARESGELPPIVNTPTMQAWHDWGVKSLRDGDIVFRLGDARLLNGYFPFSRFIARASGSEFSHTGIAAIEGGEPVIYDVSNFGVQRQPFEVWMLDNIGAFAVKRLKPEYQSSIPQVLDFCRDAFGKEVGFDYLLQPDDKALYCVEMTEKAFRSAGLKLSDPVRLGDMENAHKKIVAIFVLQALSNYVLEKPLSLEQPVFFPGNERHGIWASPKLLTIYPPPTLPLVADDARQFHPDLQ